MASDALKRLSKKPVMPADFMERVTNLGVQTDQAAALIIGALLDSTLERVILSRLVPLTKTQTNELFVGLAPLSSLSAKIKIAFALGIVGEKGRTDLELLKDIRNQFAHAFHEISFTTPEVSAACFKLKAPEGAITLTDKLDPRMFDHARMRFIMTGLLIWLALGGKSVNRPRPRKPKDSHSLAILH